MLSSRQFSWIIQTNSMILAAVLSTRWWLMCIIPSIIHNSQHKASMASKWQSYFYYEGRHRRPFPPFSSLSIYSSSCKVYTPFNIISWLTCQVEILNNNKKKIIIDTFVIQQQTEGFELWKHDRTLRTSWRPST